MDYTRLASKEHIEKTMSALKANGIEAFFVENGSEAKKKLFELLPEGAEVMNMTSVTLEAIGATTQIVESGNFRSVRKMLTKMDKSSQSAEMQKMGAAPQWAVGSVHALTEDGHVLIASATGSQLPAYVYGSEYVVWVVGAQKIVKDTEEGIKRIYEHCLPLESERAKKAYGVPGSSVNKLLIINKEKPGRITIILVNEVLGF